MKKLIVVVLLAMSVLAFSRAADAAYVYLSVTGANVNIRAEADLKGKILARANPGDMFIAEDNAVLHAADGSKWYKIVMSVGNGYVPLTDDDRFGVAAAYVHSDFARAMNATEDEDRKIAGVLAAAAAEAEVKTIGVSTSRGFLEALGSNRIVEMEAGVYNLSEWDPYLKGEGGELRTASGVSWERVYDGGELVLAGIENLTLRGAEGGKVEIVADPRYAFVLKFVNCGGIAIENLTAGHSEGGYCEGGVFGFTDSSRVSITRANMYGCGTEGLALSGVSNMKVDNSTIYECTYDIMTVTGGQNIAFEDCVFYANKQFSLVNVSGTGNMSFLNCAFNDNQGRMFDVGDTTISVSNSSFNRNETDSPIQNSRNVEFENCEFD